MTNGVPIITQGLETGTRITEEENGSLEGFTFSGKSWLSPDLIGQDRNQEK